MGFSDYMLSAACRQSADSGLLFDGVQDVPVSVCDPVRLSVAVADGAAARLVLSHGAGCSSQVDVVVGEGATLSIVELFDGGSSSMRIAQGAASRVAMTSVVAGDACAEYRTALNGAQAECDFGGVFIAGDGGHAQVKIRVEHNVADCRSASTVKGVAAGSGEGRFEGMVYVAPDAQRTDARQTSRNLTLGDRARITTLPQLEIYADDVKCSHGATVGQMDSEAVFYMRQRGLSEEQARRLQVEGFVADVVMHCAVAEASEALLAELGEKLEKL